jgi:hypothetical protein
MESSDNRAQHKTQMNIVEDEVKKLFKKGSKLNQNDLNLLNSKYNNPELTEKIQKAFLDSHKYITKKAKKFAELVRQKYGNEQVPFHTLLEKSRKLKDKYSLGDEEFAEFQRIYEQELIGIKSPEVLQPSTNMMKVLGTVSLDSSSPKMKYSDAEFKVLQDIMKLHESSKPLHSQIVLQHLQYEDCDPMALTGSYKRELGHRPGDHVHPVVVALFLPKIQELEKHFLLSNMAGLVKARHNNEPLNNRADFELFDSLSRDPNDVVCDNRSPIMDLHNRALLQKQLWNLVLNLRNGLYYNESFREFVSTVDFCRLNKNDNPDLMYGRFDGTVFKRLISAFSFRPTIVATLPVNTNIVSNMYVQNIRPVVTRTPMINLRLPPILDENTVVSLTDALKQNQLFIENGTFVQKDTSVIYSRGVLLFFVDRRSTTIKLDNSMMQFLSFNRLPVSIAGYERINTRDVEFQDSISINEDIYQLRSIVVARVAEVDDNTVNTVEDGALDKNTVIGSATYVVMPADISKNRTSTEVVLYDPLDVGHTDVNNNPMRAVDYSSNDPQSLYQYSKRYGTVFMYQLVNDASKGKLVL